MPLAMYWNLIVCLIMMWQGVTAAVTAFGKVARGCEASQEIDRALTEARGPEPSESPTVLHLIFDVRPL
jgi:hypothetical protein